MLTIDVAHLVCKRAGDKASAEVHSTLRALVAAGTAPPPFGNMPLAYFDCIYGERNADFRLPDQEPQSTVVLEEWDDLSLRMEFYVRPALGCPAEWAATELARCFFRATWKKLAISIVAEYDRDLLFADLPVYKECCEKSLRESGVLPFVAHNIMMVDSDVSVLSMDKRIELLQVCKNYGPELVIIVLDPKTGKKQTF